MEKEFDKEKIDEFIYLLENEFEDEMNWFVMFDVLSLFVEIDFPINKRLISKMAEYYEFSFDFVYDMYKHIMRKRRKNIRGAFKYEIN